MEVSCADPFTGEVRIFPVAESGSVSALLATVASDFGCSDPDDWELQLDGVRLPPENAAGTCGLETGNRVTLARSMAKHLKRLRQGERLAALPEEARQDRGVVLTALQLDATNLMHVADELKHDEDVIICALRSNGSAIRYVPDDIAHQRHIILEAVQTYGTGLTTHGTAFTDDREIVLAAALNSPWVLRSASPRLKNDRDLVMQVIARGSIVDLDGCLGPDLACDRGVVEAAVRLRPSNLRHADETLRNDAEMASLAVKAGMENPLRWVGDKARRSPELCMQAVEATIGNADYIPQSVFLQSKPLCIAVVQKDGMRLPLLPAPMNDDDDVVAAAVSKSSTALMFASERLQNNVHIVQLAASGGDSCRALQYAGLNVLSNAKFMLSMMRHDLNAFFYTADSVRDDKRFMIAAVAMAGSYLARGSDAIRNDRDVVRAAVTSYPAALGHASEALRDDESMVHFALSCDPCTLQHASHRLQNTRATVVMALTQDPLKRATVERYIGEEAAKDSEVIAVLNDTDESTPERTP